MGRFQSILYVSCGIADETEALKQALSLARNNAASLHLLVLAPSLPHALIAYHERFEAFLANSMEAAIHAAKSALKMNRDETPATISVECGTKPALRIVRHVLREDHDLVVKQAEASMGSAGFLGVDMQLLRQCPCPVWLSRPIHRSQGDIRVAVAIDPQAEETAGHDLSLELLRFARSLADTTCGKLDVISCWEFEFEQTLRHSPFVRLRDEEICSAVASAEHAHRTALDALVHDSGIGGDVRVNHVRGRPERTIPAIAEALEVDILVMGTVARTGIPGFTIGNTAESVLQGMKCSVVALKPHGFVSSVKAY